ncbi:hypothetical protein EVAR_91638_1 [Eumeta japonica]|uniref:Uncharacterized protein n=1 Tax=Eumeta variegata TaxID=151549 RepID=A0A4C2A2T2_EUMVA|nr:hypothetical protein EVAR_91638_1 [Eumeta japonica]
MIFSQRGPEVERNVPARRARAVGEGPGTSPQPYCVLTGPANGDAAAAAAPCTGRLRCSIIDYGPTISRTFTITMMDSYLRIMYLSCGVVAGFKIVVPFTMKFSKE